jgi:Leucine-rich repeat (LRR) protein
MLSLEVLHLDSNQLTGFPPNTDSWTNLKTLTASDNCIKGEPHFMFCFAYHFVSGFSRISLHTSRLFLLSLEAIPAEAMAWCSVQYVNFRQNQIEELPELVLKSWTKVCFVSCLVVFSVLLYHDSPLIHVVHKQY